LTDGAPRSTPRAIDSAMFRMTQKRAAARLLGEDNLPRTPISWPWLSFDVSCLRHIWF
jgi:hypothetical protein